VLIAPVTVLSLCCRWCGVVCLQEVPLIVAACSNGHLAVAQYLVANAAADVHSERTPSGMSCLHAAADSGHVDVVKWLVDDMHMDTGARATIVRGWWSALFGHTRPTCTMRCAPSL
jgi:hypothetical protein